MKRVVVFLFFLAAANVIAGDYIVIKYKNGKVQKIELKGKINNLASIEFYSSKENSKKEIAVSQKDNKLTAEMKTKSGKIAKQNREEDQFKIFEKQMKSQLKPTFEGMWKTNFGTLVIKIKGNKVLGLYKNGNGKIEGTLSEDGYTITGRWSEAPDYLPPKHAGKFIFKLSKTGASFKGKWGFGNEEPDSEWVGRKIK